MLDMKRLIASFEEIVGWPYVSPGTNDQHGIDCSGAFVRAFKAQNASIYHGSNRIIRAHCNGAFEIESEGQLAPGMAVFKRRTDGLEPAEYKPGGKNYKPALIGNFYHIGLVCGVRPLRIIHATTPVAKMDTALGSWSYAAMLNDVDYAGPSSSGQTVGESANQAVVTADLRLRKTPGAEGVYLLTIPQGVAIPILASRDGWAQTQYTNKNGTHHGWVSEIYLRYDTGAVEDGFELAVEDDLVTIKMTRSMAEELAEGIRAGLGVDRDD